MDPKELRIGNYVFADERIVRVVSIDSEQEDDIEIRIQDDKTSQDEIVKVLNAHIVISPIPLSREVLRSCCNFSEGGLVTLGLHSHLYYLRVRDDHIVVLNQQLEPAIHFWEVRFLHQLQNLYYALKGEEMQVCF